MDKVERAQDARIRRAADRQGLTATKSRRRDPRALDFGLWWFGRRDAPGDHWRGNELVSPESGFNGGEAESWLRGV